jgi:hypothetical protein
MLWINYRMSKAARTGWALSTIGMDDFGLMEIECRDTRADGTLLFAMIVRMSAYLISKGPIIKNGDTIGHSAFNIRVLHSPSYWNKGQTVYRVIYPK